jgi:hypothetical protein
VRRGRTQLDESVTTPAVPAGLEPIVAEAEGEIDAADEWIGKAASEPALPKAVLEKARAQLAGVKDRLEEQLEGAEENATLTATAQAVAAKLDALDSAIAARERNPKVSDDDEVADEGADEDESADADEDGGAGKGRGKAKSSAATAKGRRGRGARPAASSTKRRKPGRK